MGAGTFHPATVLRSLGPQPWKAAYVQPCRRPTDGRYGENPNRLGHYYQYQVILKPAPADIQDLYVESLVALGIDHTGRKHALGLWDGSTENAAVCQSLLADLQSRGLRTDRSLLVILDGSKALHKAVTQTFGSAALIHRCQVHKLRNILEHLPEGQRPWVRAIVARAYKQVEVAPARRLLQDLARRLEDRYPSAAASVPEGLDDTLAILTLGLFCWLFLRADYAQGEEESDDGRFTPPAPDCAHPAASAEPTAGPPSAPGR